MGVDYFNNAPWEPLIVLLPTGTTAIKLAAGNTFTCALLSDWCLVCWEFGSAYQLGNRVSIDNVGDNPDEMGDNLVAVHLPVPSSAVDVSASNGFACAATSAGDAYCWGSNGNSGRLGIGSTAAQGNNANTLQRVKLPASFTAVVKVRCRGTFVCALTASGQVGCWGANTKGQRGRGNTATVGATNAQMTTLSPVILPTGLTAISISCGFSHVCALLSNHQVVCWGEGSSGQLGKGLTASIGDGPNEMGDALQQVPLPTGRTATSVACGYCHTCFILDYCSMACWGSNAGSWG